MLRLMRLARAFTLFAAGAAAAWYLDRRRPRPDMEHVAPPPPDPLPPAEPPAATRQPPEPPVEPVEVAEPLEVDEVDESPPDPPVSDSPRRGPPPVPGRRSGAARREAYPPPDPAFAAPSEQPTVEQPAVQRGAEPADVAAVVDDLIATGHREGVDQAIVDAEIVDEASAPEPPGDAQITVAVIVELGKVPGLSPDAVSVEVSDGVVWLHGEIGDPGTIGEVERRVGALEGVERLRSLLHLPGTAPPA
jgi:hypothetical protein